MASISSAADILMNAYPTSDGKPMAETEWHRNLMIDLIRTLETFYEAEQNVCVSGNLLLFFEEGNKRKHLAPDVFVVKGVPKRIRANYLTWQEGKGTDFVIELTSSTTRHEDRIRKYKLYQDVLKVKEYFLFDPRQDYLDPPEQGYRLRAGVYRSIRVVAGRLPSQVLGLHLERDGDVLRLWNPLTERWLPTSDQRTAQAEAAHQQEANARRQAEAENERLRKEMEELCRRLPEEAGQEE